MKTNYTNTSNPAWMSRDVGDFAVIVAATSAEEYGRHAELRRRARQDAYNKAVEQQQGRDAQQKREARFTPQTQPRDINGRFRKILARLKLNLGSEATEEVAKKIEAAEAAQVAGNYELMKQNGGDLIKLLDGVKDGELPKGLTKNLRRGASDLGKILAYLPLPQGDANAKVRFSDLPPASADMVRDMVKRVKTQLGPVDARKYTAALEQFMSGARNMDSDEMAMNLNKLLRVLA